jgi:hypothetical protein
MADTMRGDLGDKPCSDCGQTGHTEIKHWGPLVPSGETGYFDVECFKQRRDDNNKGLDPRPLGNS